MQSATSVNRSESKNASIRRIPKTALAAAAVLTLAALPSYGATLYWDGNDTNANANGGAGTWNNLSSTNWDTAAVGGANSQWDNTNNDTAAFGGTAGTVTLGGGITVGGLTFNTTAYAISNGANTLTFGAANNAILFNNVAASTITGTVGGSGNVSVSTSNPANAATLTLTGTSTGGWSGTTTVNAGTTLRTLDVDAATDTFNQALRNTSGITINGGTIQVSRHWGGVNLNYVNDSAAITVNSGGTFNASNITAGNAAMNENIGAVTVNSGQFFIGQPTGGSSGQKLTLSTAPVINGTGSIAYMGALTTTAKIVVTGATATPGGQIIGPWATTGSNATTQTDYAIYNASSEVVPANIAATAENTWGVGSNVTLSGATTLTGTRTLNSLRYTGATAALGLGASNFNLETYGLLNGGSGTLTVSTTGTGGLTTPSGGGNLYLTTGSNNVTVSAPINDNAGAVTLVKSGSGILALSSTTSNFSGGVVLNAGQLTFTSNSNLGSGGGITVNGAATINAGDQYSLARTLTLNEGAVLTLNNGFGVTGVFSGNGALNVTTADDFNFTNAANTFTGAITSATSASTTYGLTFASIGDTAGAGLINLVGGSGTFRWTSASGSTTTLVNRQFAISSAGSGMITALGTTAASNLVINRDLLITGAAGARTLTLNGTNAGVNRFAGNIADGTDGTGSVVTLTKDGTGTWALGGTNTYTGNTNLSAASGRLVFQGSQSLSPSTKLVFTQTSSSVSNVRFLDDGAGTISFNRPIEFGGSNTIQALGIFVGNNNTANQGSSSGTTTGSTIQVGDITHTSLAADTNTWRLDATGANGYRLQTGTLTLNNLVTRTAGQTTVYELNPTTASLTVGAVTMATGNTGIANDGVPVLRLGGTAVGNIVSGNVTNASDYLTGQALSLQISGANDWSLNGTGNNFTGAITFTPTTTSGGRLSYASASGTNPITFAATTGFGSTLSYTGASPLTMSGLITASALTTGGITFEANGVTSADTINYSNTSSLSTTSTGTSTRFITFGGANTGDNIFAGAINNNTGVGGNTQVTKQGAGKWVLTGNSNFSGGFFLNQGTVSVASIPNGGVSSPLGANTRINLGRTNDDGILIYTGIGNSTNRDVRIGGPSAASGTGGSAILNDGTGALTFTNAAFNISQTGILFNRTLTLGGSYTGGINEIQGVIQNNTASTGLVGVTKTGAGTWRLSGTNTYTGGTAVNGGTLLINGNSSAATGAVTVASSATLGGTGSIGGAVTVDGTLSPGASIESLATGAVTLNNGSNFLYELDTTAVNGDLVVASGALTINPTSTLTLSESNAAAVLAGTKLTLINYSGTWNGGIFNGYADGSTFLLGSNLWQIEYDDTTGGSNFAGDQTLSKYVTITAVVPEPSTLGLLAMGAVGLMRRRRVA